MNAKKMWALFSLSLPIFFVGLTLGFSLPASSQAASKGGSIRIGFIDIQKAVASTKEWKKEFAGFKAEFQKEKGVVTQKEERIRKLMDDIEKQSFVLSPELKKSKEEKFRTQKKDFERYVQDLNEKFSRKEKEITDKIIVKMIKTIKKLGKSRNYTMIMEQKAVFYYDESDDLTKYAIKAYDRENG